MRDYLCIALLLVMILLLIPGCGPSEASAAEAAKPRDLSFVVINHSGGLMDMIGLEGANMPMSFRAIQDDASSELKSKKLTLPERMTLHWSDERGDRHEGSVRVWSELGASYSGQVRLTVDDRDKVVLTGE